MKEGKEKRHREERKEESRGQRWAVWPQLAA